MQVEGRGRGRRESENPPADSPQSMELDVGLDPGTLRFWHEPKSRVGCLTN